MTITAAQSKHEELWRVRGSSGTPTYISSVPERPQIPISCFLVRNALAVPAVRFQMASFKGQGRDYTFYYCNSSSRVFAFQL